MRKIVLSLVVLLTLSACAGKAVLPPPPQAIPNVSLEGLWKIGSSEQIQNQQLVDGIVIPRDGTRQIRQANRSKAGSAARVFLESGRQLKLTQTESGLFISFDRSIVESYTFGELKLVKVGPIEAQRSTGWEGNVLVIRTLDDDGALLKESYHLEAGGSIMVRQVSITHRDRIKYESRQVFHKQ